MRFVVTGGSERTRRIVCRIPSNSGKSTYLGISFFHQVALACEQNRIAFVELYQDRDLLAQASITPEVVLRATPEGLSHLGYAFDWYYRTGSSQRDRLIQSLYSHDLPTTNHLLPL